MRAERLPWGRWLLAAVAALAIPGLPATAMTLAERQALDLSAYVVRDPGAGYFDVKARRAALRDATDPALHGDIARLRMGLSCKALLAMPVIDQHIVVPSFYEDHEDWAEVADLFHGYEDAVSTLAAAQMVASDTYHAECLVTLLRNWADHDAFADFYYTPDVRQAWYAVEGSLAATAMALSTVRDLVPDRGDDLAVIDAWLLKVARKHSANPGGPEGTCCNNHFYRRATYAVAIGIMENDNDLFRFGVSALYSAVDDATPEGALPLEIRRGVRGAHYQNFATMYLVYIAEMVARQGYPAYEISRNGRTLRDIIRFDLELLADPTQIRRAGVKQEQVTPFLSDSQYLTWLEPYFSRFHDPEAAAILDTRRPAYNRTLGGYATLYFMAPVRPNG